MAAAIALTLALIVGEAADAQDGYERLSDERTTTWGSVHDRPSSGARRAPQGDGDPGVRQQLMPD